ncbi:hypothetical protein ACIO2V_11375, partial [Streptomyces sp. NPDC087534]
MPEAPSRPQGGGRRRHGDREVPAAIVFVATSGCTWQPLPAAIVFVATSGCTWQPLPSAIVFVATSGCTW